MSTNAQAALTISKRTVISPFIILVVAWLIPGAGHFLLRKWGRGGLLLLSIVSMFAIGLSLQGKVYGPNTSELLDMLNFAGDVGTGVLYFLARGAELGASSVQTAVADYGSKFIVVAGLLNFICAVDAHSLATGRKAS